MVTHILDARDHHNVSSEAQLRALQRTSVARRSRAGALVSLHEGAPLPARINHGSWLVECECGAGNACVVGWPTALCFSCGAEHVVIWPEDQAEIERLVLLRPKSANRNWEPGETLDQVRAINRENGVGE